MNTVSKSSPERQARYRARLAERRKAEMEAKGLPAAPPIATMPSRERWNSLLKTAIAHLETLANEMQTYHDERTEKWQESDKAAEMLEKISTIENSISELESI